MARLVRASTYGNDPRTGYRDPGDNNRPALAGASNDRPGIARYDRGTLGGWFRVTAPNGRTLVVQQTDIGPAPWTGAQIDVNAVAARELGYRQGNRFPTRQGWWKIEYLGKRRPNVAASAVPAKPKADAQTGLPDRAGLLRAYLQQRGNPNALLSLASTLRQ